MCFKENADLSECLGAYVMDENGLVPVPDRETDAVAALLRRIDALPTVDSIYEDVPGDSDPEYAKWFSDMEQVLRDIRKAKEAYDALADEEREQIDAESVDKLMGLWNLAERLEEMRPLADMASGTSGTCSWVIDANGTMTISPSNGSSGELEELASAVSQGWNAYKENIKKVVVRQGVKTPKNAANLFYGLTSCTEMDISGLDTSATESFLGFFDSCKMTELDISHMNTDKAVNMKWMFKGCSALTALDISRLNTQNVTNMTEMFKGSGLISLDIRNLNVRNVTDMSKMFSSCSDLESMNLSGLQAPKLTTMKSMFEGCGNLTSVNLSGMDIPSVTDMAAMFYSCTNLTTLNFDQINAPGVQKMSSMFSFCSNLKELDLTPFNTTKVTDMYGMFRKCTSLTTVDISSFDTQNVQDMGLMFDNCGALTNLDLSNFRTSNVTSMDQMFSNCSNLAALDISNFEFKNGVSCMSMLSSCKVGINTKTYNSRWGASKLYIYNKYDYTALSNTTLTAEDAKTNRILVFKPRVVTPTVIGNGTVSYSGKYGNKTASDVVYKDYYKKTALLGEKDTFDPEKFYAQQGEDLTITYTPAAKCEVSEVMVNGTKIDLAENPTAYTIKDIRANTTVSVKFRASSVTVKFNSNGGSPVGDFTGDVDGKVTKPADPTRSGYNFAGWYKDAALKQEWDFENSTLDGDTTLYAKWVENIPPQISVFAPPDGWQNQNVVLTLTFSDNVGVTKLFVKMDQGAYSEINSFGASPYKYTVTQEGAHSYTFKAQDAAGNYAETAAVTVKL
ncbi:MAG: BspA family leucine-rich repeat surface protein, partial [Clostridium sp.]|nr:BspA family leucine-rich repeat surface protein [Clostridium sp.]